MAIVHLRLYGHVARCSWTGVCVFERQKGMWTGCTEPPEFRVRMRSCSPRLEQHGGANSNVSLPARRRELVYLLCFLARVIGPSSQGARAKFGLLDKSIPASKQLVRLGRYQPIGALVSMRITTRRPTDGGCPNPERDLPRRVGDCLGHPTTVPRQHSKPEIASDIGGRLGLRNTAKKSVNSQHPFFSLCLLVRRHREHVWFPTRLLYPVSMYIKLQPSRRPAPPSSNSNTTVTP